MVSLNALIVANMAALPSTLAALNELVGGGSPAVYGRVDTGSGCGCRSTLGAATPEQIKAMLRKNELKPANVQLPPNPAPGPQLVQPLCPVDTCQVRLEEKLSCRPRTCTDPATGTQYANTVHRRNKYIWTCSNGTQYVWCDGWVPKDGNCCKMPSETPCNGNPGQILCNWRGAPSQP
jgi:hypothetical protein